MSKSQRTKGARGEREVVAILRCAYPGAKRGLTQTRGGGDVADVEGTPHWVECKLGKKPDINAAVRQARESTDGRPIAVWTRRDGETWMVTVDAHEWMRVMLLAKAAGEATA